MSVQVPIDDLADAAADYGDTAFVLVSTPGGPPRVTHSMVRFEDGAIVVSVGARTAPVLVDAPAVAVLWPADESQSMSLIADGEVSVPPAADGGEIRIRPTGAVRHRPASG